MHARSYSDSGGMKHGGEPQSLALAVSAQSPDGDLLRAYIPSSADLAYRAYAPRRPRSATGQASSQGATRSPFHAASKPQSTGPSPDSQDQQEVKEDGASAAQQAESQEIAELQSLLGRDRDSPVPMGVYVRYQHSLENLERATQGRRERAARDAVREEMERQQYSETQERRARMRGRDERAKEEWVRSNLSRGREMRDFSAMCREAIAEQRRQLHEQTKVKVEAARSNDARLDAKEDAADEAERQEATRARRARQLAASSFKKELGETNRRRVDEIRDSTSHGLSRAMSARGRKKRSEAETTRTDFQKGRQLFAMYEDERLKKAAAAKEAAMRSRQNAVRAKEAMIRDRQAAAVRQDRVNEARTTASKEAVMRDNQSKRRTVFGGRYAPREAAILFERSAFKKLYAMDDVADSEIDQANAELLKRIETVAPRTDDFVEDDAAGIARVEAAMASKLRKEAEAQRIARENAELRARLRNVKAVTDDDVDDDAAGLARVKVAAASRARKAAEAAALAKANAEMAQRIRSVKAVTDDDITDDVDADGTVGAGRSEAAARSRARKAAAAKQLSSENVAMRDKLRHTAARTDDDVMDEAAGLARAEVAAESAARKEAEAAQLAKENSAMSERIKNTKAKVDDDIDDDAAGMARKGYDIHHREWMDSQQ